MTDTSAHGGGEEYGDEDRLPWLESAEEDHDDGPSPWRVLVLVIVGLLVVAAIVLGYMWFSTHRIASGNGELINAQEGNYKTPPEKAGGMKVAGEGETRFVTSKGGESDGAVDVDAVPEQPVDGKKAPVPSQGADQGSKKVVAQVPDSSGAVKAKAPARAGGGGSASAGGSVVQIGSFPSKSGANTAWSRYSDRFAYLAPLGKTIQKAEVDGDTVYRLRVNAGSVSQARELCGKLKVAGEACYIPSE